MKFADIFITVILFIPIIGALLYTIFFPKDSASFGKRWQFKNEDLEPSDEVIKYNRTMGIVVLIIAAVILITLIYKECQ